jgi:indolepyruvate ferredoxin oxidoreductase
MGKLTKVKLSDCYEKSSGPAMFNGVQALVRLLIEQARLDREAGLKTGGLVSGYPGSPLGGLDIELNRMKSILDKEGIVFQPAVNEELAATALWGAQQIGLYDDTSYEGVFGLWYGKAPGFDRSMDAFRHANLGGVAPKGGLVIAVGDDPSAKSSAVTCQSEHSFQSLGIPYFHPRRAEDIITMGLQAFALSRYAGVCVGMKIVTDTADANIIQDTGLLRPKLVTPDQEQVVHVSSHEHPLVREQTLMQVRHPAVKTWSRLNSVNHQIGKSPKQKKLGIVSVGKAVIETIEALHVMGFDKPQTQGIGIFSVGMPYPLEESAILEFVQGYEKILVIEEKTALVEDKLASLLINTEHSPRLYGKKDKNGDDLIPETGEVNCDMLISAIAKCLSGLDHTPSYGKQARNLNNLPQVATRTPFYCAGCPHNSSTKLPEGAITGMGVGCHLISTYLTPESITNFVPMGGEGAFWIGRAPFSDIRHTFQNLGDGTYAHSAYLAIRAAIAAKVNMTFKILYNDAVAMTGGQPVMGGSSPDAIARQLVAEGVKAIAVVSDEPKITKATGDWPKMAQFHHRRDIIQVQEDLGEVKGISSIIYVQTCAAELRRQRKRGITPDRPEHLFINEAVCEGCGDCASKSNCVAVKPVIHPDGIKRQIDQSVCNKDYSCNEGFCPSFVSVLSDNDAASITADVARPDLPKAKLPPPPAAKMGISNIFIAGIGGTGVSTLSAVLVMAGHLDGVYAQGINQTGLSQKNGSVTSEVRMSPNMPLDHRTVRLPIRSADVLIGCDAVVATGEKVLKALDSERTSAVINARIDPVGVFGVGGGQVVDDSLLMARLDAVMDPDKIIKHQVSYLAERLMGSTMTANVMLLGVALQLGLIPVRPSALEEAFRINGVSIDDNLKAIQWGRWLAVDADKVHRAAGIISEENAPKLDAMSGNDAVNHFAERLTEYQHQNYAERYREHMTEVKRWLSLHNFEDDMLVSKAARATYRLMAIKDEYEVGRLMTSEKFKNEIHQRFGNVKSIRYNVAPPLLGWIKNKNGAPKKFKLGSWLGIIFAILSKMKVLRGTPFDFFAMTAERRRERKFRDDKLAMMTAMLRQGDSLSLEQFDAFLEAIISVRGYGYVKDASMDAAETTIKGLVTEKKDDQNVAKKRA